MKYPTMVFMCMLVALLSSACASSQPVTDPLLVIEAFHGALNDGSLDAAMDFVADDARFITNSLYEGKEQIRGFYEGALAINSQWELSDLKTEGEKVTWISQVTRDSGGLTPFPAEAVVQNGKIVSLKVR